MTAVTRAEVIRLTDMHAVYRMYDGTGRLLYLGVTGNVARRFNEHAAKRWFLLVSNITLEWRDSRPSAEIAESAAIASEKPFYNVKGINAVPKQKDEVKPAPNLLADIRKIFGDANGLHWVMVIERLKKLSRATWGDLTPPVISAQCRALGVPSVGVTIARNTQRGCRRRDVEQALLRSGRHLVA